MLREWALSLREQLAVLLCVGVSPSVDSVLIMLVRVFCRLLMVETQLRPDVSPWVIGMSLLKELPP